MRSCSSNDDSSSERFLGKNFVVKSPRAQGLWCHSGSAGDIEHGMVEQAEKFETIATDSSKQNVITTRARPARNTTVGAGSHD